MGPIWSVNEHRYTDVFDESRSAWMQQRLAQAYQNQLCDYQREMQQQIASRGQQYHVATRVISHLDEQLLVLLCED
ncbi:hypothetical protein [Burkholderia gladioli]|uniref:hypothetical protein n=1 Tax=Burkholderia gladioli TaxID=28095 RepID=UPI003D1B621B